MWEKRRMPRVSEKLQFQQMTTSTSSQLIPCNPGSLSLSRSLSLSILLTHWHTLSYSISLHLYLSFPCSFVSVAGSGAAHEAWEYRHTPSGLLQKCSPLSWSFSLIAFITRIARWSSLAVAVSSHKHFSMYSYIRYISSSTNIQKIHME